MESVARALLEALRKVFQVVKKYSPAEEEAMSPVPRSSLFLQMLGFMLVGGGWVEESRNCKAAEATVAGMRVDILQGGRNVVSEGGVREE